VVHGHDVDVGLDHATLGKRIRSLMESADSMVFVSQRLKESAEHKIAPMKKSYVIPCHSEMDAEWARPMKPWKGRWRREAIDILFPSDSRRPEKNHLLALQAGEILEQRGWIVGMTTLKQQPRSIVWDRMIVADVTLITSHRESGPLVARESILCGTPVVSTNVGDVGTYLPDSLVVDEATPEQLADACETALETNWIEYPITLPQKFSQESVSRQWSSLLQGLEEEE
jgi:glycosyltransferase involved in cell wall biosynthesis